MIRDCARGLGIHLIQRVRAICGTGWFLPDVRRRAKQIPVRWNIGVRLLLFQRPRRFGAIDGFQVCNTRRLLAGLPRLDKVWDGDCG